jgi:hypothetical protein
MCCAAKSVADSFATARLHSRRGAPGVPRKARRRRGTSAECSPRRCVGTAARRRARWPPRWTPAALVEGAKRSLPTLRARLQRLFVHATRNLFDHHHRDMAAINIISARRAIPYGWLHRHDVFEGIDWRLRSALSSVGVPAVGGFDISANEHQANAFRPHWMPHAWILAPGRRMRRVEKDLRAWFPATQTVPRPVRMTSFDGAPAGFAYALKPDFERRISLGCRFSFNTRKKPIWRAQRVELALALDRAGLAARLFLHGYELVIARGDVEIVRIASAREAS